MFTHEPFFKESKSSQNVQEHNEKVQGGPDCQSLNLSALMFSNSSKTSFTSGTKPDIHT